MKTNFNKAKENAKNHPNSKKELLFLKLIILMSPIIIKIITNRIN